jgi:hypothetical protein
LSSTTIGGSCRRRLSCGTSRATCHRKIGVPEDDFTLISGKPKAFHYVAQSGKGLDRNFCPDCGARVFTTNLEGFPGTIFVTLGSLDNPQGIEPMLEMFTKHRLAWAKPLDVPQFENMPS